MKPADGSLSERQRFVIQRHSVDSRKCSGIPRSISHSVDGRITGRHQVANTGPETGCRKRRGQGDQLQLAGMPVLQPAVAVSGGWRRSGAGARRATLDGVSSAIKTGKSPMRTGSRVVAGLTLAASLALGIGGAASAATIDSVGMLQAAHSSSHGSSGNPPSSGSNYSGVNGLAGGQP
jgi:hypothetical protein